VTKFAFAVLSVASLSTAAMAQSVFDGTWKIDLKAPPASKPIVWLIEYGLYRCDSCLPPIVVKANGQDQRVMSQPYDTISVTIVDARTIQEIEKKSGKVVSSEKFTVSPDGNAVTDEFPNGEMAGDAPRYTKLIFTRITKGPRGSHAISGSWRLSRMENVADKFLLITLEAKDGTFQMSRPTGESFNAKLDGTEAPYKGDPNVNVVSVRFITNHIIEETDKRGRKTLRVTRMTVTPDGKTMIIESEDAVTRNLTRYSAYKR
jgi:hypothetical protein